MVKDIEADIDAILTKVYADPLGHVMASYPWATDVSIQQVPLAEPWRSRYKSEFGPDVWACEFLDDLGREIRKRKFNGRDAVIPIQFATASGHGIGKSVMVAWLVKFIMDTRPFCRITVTATTADQLRSKTWAEVGKWHAMSLTANRFTYRSGRSSMMMFSNEFPQRWFANAVTCREENSEAFAGQHASDSTSCYIFDEASGIPSKIFKVREGGLTDGEPMTFDFGNPTKNSGEFHAEFHDSKIAPHFVKRQIDSRDVYISNKAYSQRLIDTYGEDSDFVKVRVKGQFPSAGSTQFIGNDIVDEAMQRELYANRRAKLVLGVDVARFGANESVIKPRLGDDLRSWPARRFQGLDSVQLTGQVITCVSEFRALGMKVHSIFVDGGGVGGPVVDQLRHLGYPVVEVNFGGSPRNKADYRYRGDEMWGDMRKHIMSRAILPEAHTSEGEDLRNQLTAREYGFTPKTQIHLESKEDMEKRGVASPDIADAYALTYAQEMAPEDTDQLGHLNQPMSTIHEYDPLEYNDVDARRPKQAHSIDWFGKGPGRPW